MCMFFNLGQPLPMPSTIATRSVLSFSWRENSKEISFRLGQLKACHNNKWMSKLSIPTEVAIVRDTRKRDITILEREQRSESHSVLRLDEQREKLPKLEQPSILRLLRQRLSATKRPSSPLYIRNKKKWPNISHWITFSVINFSSQYSSHHTNFTQSIIITDQQVEQII